MTQDRQYRKATVFHIMYGQAKGATDAEMSAWRMMAVDFINGARDDCPPTLEEFRASQSRGYTSTAEQRNGQ